MDWMEKAMLTALLVAGVLFAGRLFGRKTAGLLAGLPTVTGPALVWIELDFGPAHAIEAATGAVAACALCALFALVYERASRRVNALAALLAASAAGAAATLPLQWLRGELLVAWGVASAAAWAAYRAIPERAPNAQCAVRVRGEIWLTAAVSAGVSAAVGLCAPHAGAYWAGMLASPPLLAAVVAMHHQLFLGPRAVGEFMRGYAAGLFGRAVFGVAFALLVATAGLTAAALAGTLICCGCTAAALRLASPRTQPA